MTSCCILVASSYMSLICHTIDKLHDKLLHTCCIQLYEPDMPYYQQVTWQVAAYLLHPVVWAWYAILLTSYMTSCCILVASSCMSLICHTIDKLHDKLLYTCCIQLYDAWYAILLTSYMTSCCILVASSCMSLICHTIDKLHDKLLHTCCIQLYEPDMPYYQQVTWQVAAYLLHPVVWVWYAILSTSYIQIAHLT